MGRENDDSMGDMDKEHIAELVKQAMELSELALEAGMPQASALLTLAASDLRKNVA